MSSPSVNMVLEPPPRISSRGPAPPRHKHLKENWQDPTFNEASPVPLPNRLGRLVAMHNTNQPPNVPLRPQHAVTVGHAPAQATNTQHHATTPMAVRAPNRSVHQPAPRGPQGSRRAGVNRNRRRADVAPQATSPFGPSTSAGGYHPPIATPLLPPTVVETPSLPVQQVLSARSTTRTMRRLGLHHGLEPSDSHLTSTTVEASNELNVVDSTFPYDLAEMGNMPSQQINRFVQPSSPVLPSLVLRGEEGHQSELGDPEDGSTEEPAGIHPHVENPSTPQVRHEGNNASTPLTQGYNYLEAFPRGSVQLVDPGSTGTRPLERHRHRRPQVSAILERSPQTYTQEAGPGHETTPPSPGGGIPGFVVERPPVGTRHVQAPLDIDSLSQTEGLDHASAAQENLSHPGDQENQASLILLEDAPNATQDPPQLTTLLSEADTPLPPSPDLPPVPSPSDQGHYRLSIPEPMVAPASQYNTTSVHRSGANQPIRTTTPLNALWSDTNGHPTYLCQAEDAYDQLVGMLAKRKNSFLRSLTGSSSPRIGEIHFFDQEDRAVYPTIFGTTTETFAIPYSPPMKGYQIFLNPHTKATVRVTPSLGADNLAAGPCSSAHCGGVQIWAPFPTELSATNCGNTNQTAPSVDFVTLPTRDGIAVINTVTGRPLSKKGTERYQKMLQELSEEEGEHGSDVAAEDMD
ncbi:hypothetical protein NMY22_g8607 [Coprinellus aureogranulatus]|nr:hypothetical protein NMY22_g8607 [Coprinellus aureogranulatus]